jgi:hypothetical protein
MRMLICFTLIFCLLAACKKKEEDLDNIRFKITSPTKGAEFMRGDSLKCMAVVFANSPIRQIELSFYNSLSVKVGKSIVINTQSLEVTLDTLLFIDPDLFSNGTYQLRIYAKTQQNTAFDAVNFLVSKLEVVQAYFLLLEETAGNNTNLYSYRSGSQPELIMSLHASYQHMYKPSLTQNNIDFCWLASETQAKLQCVNLTTKNQVWEKQYPTLQSQKSLSACVQYADNVYVALPSAEAYSFTTYHSPHFTAVAETNFYITDFYDFNHTILLLTQRQVTGSNYLITQYYKNTSLIFTSYPLNYEVLGYTFENENAALVVVNNNGSLKLYRYLLTQNLLNFVRDLPITNFTKLIDLNKDFFLIQTHNEVHICKRSDFSIRKIYTATQLKQVQKSFDGNEIFILDGKQLKVSATPFIAEPTTITTFTKEIKLFLPMAY